MSGHPSADTTTQIDKRGPKPSSASASSSSTTSSPCRAPSSSHHDATDPPSLASTFLHRDIQPDGHRFLLPFLTTMDHLRLSECCHDLLDYRYHLTKVQIINPHPSILPTPGEKKGLEELLSNQHGLEYLHVAHTSMLWVLELVSDGSFKGLKTLNQSGMTWDDRECKNYLALNALWQEYAVLLKRVFNGGGLRIVEELNVSGWALGSNACYAVMGAREEGMCPQLQRLKLARIRETSPGLGHTVAAALESGHLRHLREIDLSNVVLEGDDGGGVAIAGALQGWACRQLVKLDLSGCHLSLPDFEALGEAMRSGSCAKLEDLRLTNSIPEGFMAIFEAQEAGSCPSLKRLDLSRSWMPVESATALSHALRSGHCHQLQWLELYDVFKDRDASLCVMQAIQQGALPNLLHLGLGNTSMGQEHGRVLGEAIGGGALSKLEELRVSWNLSLGDGGVVPIMAGLEGGGCRHLKRLEIGGVHMGSQGGLALAGALASGHLTCLQELNVHDNRDNGDEAMVEVIKGLRDKCHRVYKLSVADTGMGVMAGQALVQALQNKAWPELRKVNASDNQYLLCDEGVVMGLVGVLERLADLCPRMKEVEFAATGLNEKEEAGGKLTKLLSWW